MTSVAAVDCGTNAIRLLLVEQDKDGCVHEVARRMEIVRLGEGVDKNGVFDADAIERTRVKHFPSTSILCLRTMLNAFAWWQPLPAVMLIIGTISSL